MTEQGFAFLEPPKVVEIESERLILKTLQMTDLPELMPILTNPDVMQWTSQGPVANVTQGERWLSARSLGPDVFNFAIRERNAKQASPIIGLLGSYHWPEVGYLIHPDHAGKGHATEAMKAFLSAYFDRVPTASEGGTGYDYIEGVVDTENFASQRVLEKCGYQKVEVRENDCENSMGVRSIAVYRLARHGHSLVELGLAGEGSHEKSSDDMPPEPPFQ